MDKPELMVFDLDGTLIDSLDDLAAAINVLRTHYGLPEVDRTKASTIVGDGVVCLVKRALGDTSADFDEALKYYRAYYAGHQLVRTGLYPGVAEGLAELRRSGVALTVATNKPSANATAILEALGVMEHFAAVIGGDAGVPLKPAPDVLLQLKARFGSGNCWMVGDHYTDLEAGRRAGFFRVFAGYGFGNRREEIPDMTVFSFTELVDAALRGRVKNEEV